MSPRLLRRARLLPAALLLMSGAAAYPASASGVPLAAPPSATADSTTTSYAVGGVRVVQRTHSSSDIVAVYLYLLGGTRQLTTATQGVERMLLEVSEYGTASYPGDRTRLAWGRTGSRLVLDPSEDWTIFGFQGLRQEFDSSWNVFADRLMHPALDSKKVALVRDRLTAEARQLRNDPDRYLRSLADSVAFAGHPYALDPDGTPEALAALDSAALAQYAAAQLVTSRLLLVVVGNLSRAQVESAVGRSLARLPAGSYAWTLPPPLARTPSSVAMVQRPLATNYILGLFQGPAASASDLPAFHVATSLFSSMIFGAVREQHGLSYAAGSTFIERGVSAGAIYVTTKAPDLVMPMIRAQLDTLRRLGSFDIRLSRFTDEFALEYLAQRMTSAAQAEALGRAQLYQGDYRLADQELDDIRKVNLGRMHSVITRYFSDVHFVFLGDTVGVHRDRFTDF